MGGSTGAGISRARSRARDDVLTRVGGGSSKSRDALLLDVSLTDSDSREKAVDAAIEPGTVASYGERVYGPAGGGISGETAADMDKLLDKSSNVGWTYLQQNCASPDP